MRILLTGATGFVGSSFVRFIAKEHEVVCLGRKPLRDSVSYVDFEYVDLSDNSSVKAAATAIQGDFDTIIHLAAYVPKESSEDILQDSFDVNVKGTINLLEAFKGRFHKLIIGSSAEVYDQARILDIITEDTPMNANSYYGVTKLSSELIAQTFGKKNNIPVIIMRFSVMYGPDDPISRALPNFIKKALKNEVIEVVNGEVLRDYIYIDDVVESIYLALSSTASGVMNIGTGKGVSIKQAAQDVIKAAHSKSELVIKPGYKGVDIILSTQKAEEMIGFKAHYFFPANIAKMIDSYR